MFLQGEVFYQLRENRKFGVRLKKKKGGMVFYVQSPGGLPLDFVCLSFRSILFCFKMKKRNCIKILSVDHWNIFFLSPFKFREITFCRKKKERVECKHTEPRSAPADFRQLLYVW